MPSSAAAATRARPELTRIQNGGAPICSRPLLRKPMNSTPAATPTIDPLPPPKATPPSSTALSTSISRPSPSVGGAASSREAMITAARPAHAPLVTYEQERQHVAG